MKSRLHGDTTRPQVIEAIVTSPTFEDAALALGFHDGAVLRKRCKALGLNRRRVKDVLIIYAKESINGR